jgi:membrane fusion protein (multidrug efflux system)
MKAHGQLLASITVAAFLLSGCSRKAHVQAMAAMPPDVLCVHVIQQDVPVYQEWVGSTEGQVNAQIRPQVSGYLLKQNYKEGHFVKRGDVLFEIDPRTFQAELDQAKGRLDQAKAQAGKAEQDVRRYTPLAEQSAISRQELDDAIQADLAAKAAVTTAEAAVARAQLDLGFTRITSPIDGISGIAEVQLGDLVGPSNLLTTVSSVDPIKVYFPASEQEYLRAADRLAKAQQNPDEAGDDFEMILGNGTVYPRKGKFLLADRQVDVRTGTIRVAASFPNPGNLLRPGQFAKVRALMDTKKGAAIVPQRAVTELQGTYQVAVVESDNKVTVRPVKVSQRVGQNWVVDEGLKPGERVVAEGVQKVRPGTVVNPKPFAATTASATAPNPAKPVATNPSNNKK